MQQESIKALHPPAENPKNIGTGKQLDQDPTKQTTRQERDNDRPTDRAQGRRVDLRKRKSPARKRSPPRSEKKNDRHSKERRSRPNKRHRATRPPLEVGGNRRARPRGGPPIAKRRARSPSRTGMGKSRRKSGLELSLPVDSDEATTEDADRLAKEIRNAISGRQTFGHFPKSDRYHIAKLFATSGYKTANSIRTTQEQAMRYSLADLREGATHRKSLNELRLVIAICDLCVIQKDEDKPKYEEIATPTKLRKWGHSMSKMGGFQQHGQDMCDHFSFDLAKERREKHQAIPFALDELRKDHWVPRKDARLRSLVTCEVVRKSRKRPSGDRTEFRSWAT